MTFTASSGLHLLILSKFSLSRKSGRKKEEQLWRITRNEKEEKKEEGKGKIKK